MKHALPLRVYRSDDLFIMHCHMLRCHVSERLCFNEDLIYNNEDVIGKELCPE
jgi:hypothetical protein